MAAETKVWCLMINDKNKVIGKKFSVVAKQDTDIDDLRKQVKQSCSNALEKVDYPDLAVWMCKKQKLFSTATIGEVEIFLESIRFDENNEELESVAKVMSLGLTNGEVLLVQVPVTTDKEKRDGVSSSKRKHLEYELDKRKRSKLAKAAPSLNANRSTYEDLQKDPSERILDDRPEADPHMPPISLLYPGFGMFLDFFEGRIVHRLPEAEVSKIKRVVDDFAERMCRFYPLENERRDAAINILKEIFKSLIPGAIGSVNTDGHFDGPHKMASMIFEFKNWVTGVTSLPEPKLVSYFAHSQVKAINLSDDSDKKSFCGRRFPCIGISIVGSDIRFHAILTLGHRFRFINLTPSISCIRASCDGFDRDSLHRAFIAAVILRNRIHDDMRNLEHAPIYNDVQPPYLPDITKIGDVEFKNLEPWEQTQPYRYLYHATTKGENSVLVKFCRQYSVELHRFCADRGHAPKLHGHECLSGGWCGVVMEHLEGYNPISVSDALREHNETWKTQLKDLVDSFHKEGLVHGDLRDANIICNEQGKIYLIDFDWGGQDGQVSYPTMDLNEDLLKGRSSETDTITKADDLRVLDITFKKLDEIRREQGWC